uniref:Topoisomerase n=1 Tax=Prevotella sp. GTC17254 TaxID=3236794 RepID=A0AB33J3F3_9BACT
MNEAQKILQMTDGGLTVFTHYLGEKCLARTFRNPFRKDSQPSCHLYANKGRYGNGQYYLQDFGDSSFCGNCFAIVGRLCNINVKTNFREVLQVIDRDLGLGIFEGQRSECHMVAKKTAMVQHRRECSTIASFEVETQPFMPWEEEYWRQYGVGLSTLKRYNVKSIRSCTFTKSSGRNFAIYGSRAVPTYGYFFDSGKRLKIYRPKAKTRFMYAGHFPKPYIFGYDQLPEKGETVFITGGEKDVMSLAAHGFHAICLNSETANVPEDLLREFSRRFMYIAFLYDTDETGRKESALRVQQYNGRYNVLNIDLPLSGQKTEKDISDFFRLGHTTEELQSMIDKQK